MSVYIREISKRFASRGIASYIFTRKDDPGSPPELDLPDGCHLVHVNAGPEARIDKNDLFYHLPDFYRGVADYARTEGINFRIVHSNYWLSGWVGRRLGRLWGVPWLHSAHTLGRVKDRDRPPGAAREPAHRIAVEDDIVRNCNRLISPTAQEIEDLSTLYDAGRGCVALVSPGVDTDVFRPMDDKRRELAIRGDEHVMLFVGRLERLKGLDVLINALAILDGDGINTRLICVGENSSSGVHEAERYGGERGRLRSLADVLGVADRVQFVGKVGHEMLARYYGLADVCAVPSYSESFGFVALEAQACGTPVVASRVGGLRQLVIDGITGVTVAGHDPRDYATALQRIFDDEVMRERMGTAGMRLARAYSWETTADRLLTVYEETEAEYDRAASALLG
jgi:D-inositol-3-phosphate glycosyltransferase